MISVLLKKMRQSRYFRDIAWQSAGNGLAQALSLIAMPILTRLYLPADFGTLNIFTQVVAVCAIFLTWRYEYMIVLPKEEPRANSIFRFLTIMGLVGTLVLTPIAYYQRETIAALLGDHSVGTWLVLAPISALVMSLSIGLQQRIQRKQDYRNAGLSEVVNKGAFVSSRLLGSLMLPNIFGLIVAGAVGTIGKSLWLLRSLNKKQDVDNSTLDVSAYATARQYFRLTSALVVSQVQLVMVSLITVAFIAKIYDVGTLGQYSLVLTTLYLPFSVLGNAIGQVYYERAAKQHANGEKFDELWRATAKHLCAIALPLFGFVILVAPWAYPFVFGSQWQPAGQYATVLALNAAASFMTAPMDRTCLIVGAWWYAPILHGTRLASTAFVIWLAWHFQWTFETFLKGLVIQTVMIYAIDGWAGWRFATKR